MARVKRAVNAQKKRRTTLELASGYRGQRSRLYRKAKEQMLHSLNYAYRDRRARKGDFRQLWITRINAAARAERHDLQPVHPGPEDRRASRSTARSSPSSPSATPAAFAALVDVARGERCPPQDVDAHGRDRRLSTPAHHRRTTREPPGTERTPRVVAARKLLRRAGRDRAGRFLVEGAQAVREALAVATVHELFVTATAAARHPDLVAAARAAGVRVRAVTDRAAEALSDTVTPQGIVAVCDLARRARSAPRSPGRPRSSRCWSASRTRVTRAPSSAWPTPRAPMPSCSRATRVDPHNGKAVRASTGSVFHLPLARERDAAAVLEACRAAGLTLAGRGRPRRAGPARPGCGRRPGRPDRLGVRGRGARTRAGAGCRRRPPGAGADPRPGREPQPRDGRRGVPLRERAGVTHRLSAGGSAAPLRRPAAAGSAPMPRVRTPTGPARGRAGSTRGTRPRRGPGAASRAR